MLDAVTLDHEQLPYFSKRAKRLRPGSVQDHTIKYAWMAGIDAIVRGEGIGLLVCRLRTTLISLVVPVRLAACSEESSVLKRLPEPLLFRIQYRMARVALSETLLRSLLT